MEYVTNPCHNAIMKHQFAPITLANDHTEILRALIQSLKQLLDSGSFSPRAVPDVLARPKD
jgi:hypothetical protein